MERVIQTNRRSLAGSAARDAQANRTDSVSTMRVVGGSPAARAERDIAQGEPVRSANMGFSLRAQGGGIVRRGAAEHEEVLLDTEPAASAAYTLPGRHGGSDAGSLDLAAAHEAASPNRQRSGEMASSTAKRFRNFLQRFLG